VAGQATGTMIKQHEEAAICAGKQLRCWGQPN